MDPVASVFDFLRETRQERAIGRLQDDVERLRSEKDRGNWSWEDKVKVLELENLELRSRLAALTRLLIAKELVTAEEVAAQLYAAPKGPT